MTNETAPIDGIRITVTKEATVLEAAWKAKSFLPTLCRDPINQPLSTPSPPLLTTALYKYPGIKL